MLGWRAVCVFGGDLPDAFAREGHRARGGGDLLDEYYLVAG